MGTKIDIIIPAYKAQRTILRTVASIATQTILSDLTVTIVNDDPGGESYHQIVKMYKPYMDIREIKMKKNGGPGQARQYGIDKTSNPYFTCIDADDTFMGTLALEQMREAIEETVILPTGQRIEDAYKCVSSTFIQLGEKVDQCIPHPAGDMVWMFGKLYRRDFIEKYKIRFDDSRANEDTGFNTMVRLLCTNPGEQIRYLPDPTYYWHYKADSITRINDGQYQFDQCMCGWTDNMIRAITHVRKLRPFDQQTAQWAVSCMLRLYYYFVECKARKPVFADQEWEYVKKYYHMIYEPIEDQVTDELFSQMYSAASQESWNGGGLVGVIPHIGVKEFVEKLHKEEYDPEAIYKVWEKIPEELRDNNVRCGVCPEGYAKRPTRK